MAKSKKEVPWILLVCTGAGNTIQGGADIWVNNFLKEVWPTLPNRVRYRLLIDSKRPVGFNPSSLPAGLRFHFHYDDPSITEQWGRESNWVHFLHPHYHMREHLLDVSIATVYLFTCYAIYLWLKKVIK